MAAFLWVLCGSERASRAQSAPQIQLRADDNVGVGETLTLQLSASSSEDMPADPQLAGTHGFVVRGQNQAPAQTHFIINGVRSDRYTLNVSWALEAQRAGTFKVGPASVAIGGRRYASQALTIHVLPPGQAARPRPAQPQFPQLPPGFQSPFGPSPFDLWKGMVQGFDNEPAPQPHATETDPKLSL
ncbi:MAG: BatD family protein, partial [Myxococcales bacterium]|nr:BatD family protein [Myxococcales bacterium]